MRKIQKVFLVIGLIIVMVMTASVNFASVNQFVGVWENIDPNGGLTKLDIRVAGNDITVQAWGKCVPTDCDWGRVSAYAYGPNVSSNLFNTAKALSAVFKPDFCERLMIIRPSDNNRLQVEVLTRFTDGGARSNYISVDTFKLKPPTREDCIPYNPANLKIVNEGTNGWLLTDGRSRMLMLDNEIDARNALALARRHTAQCFIGRNNTRPNRRSYIVQYWSGNSGITTTISPEDSLPYNPANLRIVNEGDKGWLLTDGVSRMLMLDNEQDAQMALDLARRYTKHCFIGRNNKRPNREDYIVEYWK